MDLRAALFDGVCKGGMIMLRFSDVSLTLRCVENRLETNDLSGGIL